MAAPIPDLYERYKIGTKRVVQWLAEASGKSADNGTVVRIPLKEMTELANHILETATNLKPAAFQDIDSIIRILEDVIARRSECAVWYTRATVDADKGESFERSHQGHRHFIDVLRAVLACLKETFRLVTDWHGKPCKSKKHDMLFTPSANAAKVAGNIYEGLGVQEPSIEFLAATAADVSLGKSSSLSDTSAPALPKVSKSKRKKERKKASKAPVYELETQAEDGEFALWCLFKESYQIRLFVKDLWQEYVAGNTSFPTAASITDKAFMLIQHGAESFSACHTAFSTMEQVADHLKVNMNVEGKRIKSFQCKGLDDAAQEIETMELVCAPAYLHLLIARQTYTGYKNGNFDEDQDRKIAYHANAHPLTRAALAFLADTHVYGQAFANLVALAGSDIFTRDLYETFGAGSTPLHTVIEYQIYMDIMEITDKISWSLYNALFFTKETMQWRIQSFERHDEGVSSRLAVKCGKSEVRTRCQKIMTEGLEQYAHLTDAYKLDPEFFDTHVEYPWIVKLPVFGGMLIEELTVGMSEDGLSVCDKDCIVMSVAHMYRACRASGLLRKPWKDMDLFIAITRPESLKLPPAAWSSSALLNSAKHYGAAVGIVTESSKQTNAKNGSKRRLPLPSIKEIERRRVRFTPLVQSLSGRAAKSGNITVSKQPKLAAFQDDLLQWANEYLKNPTRSVDEAIRDRWKTGSLTITDVLATLKYATENRELSMLFDRHELMIKCCKLIEGVKALTDLAIYRKLPAGYSVVQLTDEILWEAVDVGAINMRKGSPAALLEVAMMIEYACSSSKGNTGFGLGGNVRDDFWYCRPNFALAADLFRRDGVALLEETTDNLTISVAGQDIAFELGKMSEEAEEKQRSSRERYDRMMAKVDADALNGTSTMDSIRAFKAEELESMKGGSA